MSSLLVRCSPEELKDLTRRAKAQGKSRAALIRELLWPPKRP